MTEFRYIVEFPNEPVLLLSSAQGDTWSYFRNVREVAMSAHDDQKTLKIESQWSRAIIDYLADMSTDVLDKKPIPSFSFEFGIDLLFAMNFFGVPKEHHNKIVREFSIMIIDELRSKEQYRFTRMSAMLERIPDPWLEEMLNPKIFNMRYFPYFARCEGKIRSIAFAHDKISLRAQADLMTKSEWDELCTLCNMFPPAFKVCLLTMDLFGESFNGFEPKEIETEMNLRFGRDIFAAVVEPSIEVGANGGIICDWEDFETNGPYYDDGDEEREDDNCGSEEAEKIRDKSLTGEDAKYDYLKKLIQLHPFIANDYRLSYWSIGGPAIDQIRLASGGFEDFLEKCDEYEFDSGTEKQLLDFLLSVGSKITSCFYASNDTVDIEKFFTTLLAERNIVPTSVEIFTDICGTLIIMGDVRTGARLSFRKVKLSQENQREIINLCLRKSIERLNFYCWGGSTDCTNIKKNITTIVNGYFHSRATIADKTLVSDIKQIKIAVHDIAENVLDWIQIPDIRSSCFVFEY
jgi:hypothetical protein